MTENTILADTPAVSQTFDFKRLADCFRFYIATHRKELITSGIGLFLLPTVTFLLMLWGKVGRYQYLSVVEADVDFLWSYEFTVYIFLTLFAAAAMGGQMFADISDRRRLMRMLEVPASMLEKLLVRFVIYVPCLMVVMILGTILGDAVRVLIIHCFTPYGDYVHTLPVGRLLTLGLEFGKDARIDGVLLTAFYMGVLVSGATFALGATFFRKHTFIKTGVSLFFLSMILSYISYASVRIFFPGGFTMIGGELETTNWVQVFVIGIIVTLFLYGLTYLRLKETEIVNRW